MAAGEFPQGSAPNGPELRLVGIPQAEVLKCKGEHSKVFTREVTSVVPSS